MTKQIADLLPELSGDGLVEDSGFSAFWKNYPRKTDKKAATRAWEKLGEKDRLAAASGALYHTENNPQWRDQSLIPHPSTFLNGRRWEDEIVIPKREKVIEDKSDLGKMVWSAMTQLFGNSWITKHGDTPPPVWKSQLSGLTPEDIKRALRYLVDSGEQHPPSLPYFVKLCRSNTLPEFKQLPRPERNEELAFEAFTQLRKILK